MARTTVGVEGLADLRRALGKMDRTLQTGLRDRLKDAAEVVAAEARRIAVRGTRPIPAGRRPARRMAEAVVPFTRGAVAGVRAPSRAPDGFPYPRRIEYQRGGAPFLRPALEREAPEVQRRMESLLDDLADDWSNRA